MRTLATGCPRNSASMAATYRKKSGEIGFRGSRTTPRPAKTASTAPAAVVWAASRRHRGRTDSTNGHRANTAISHQAVASTTPGGTPGHYRDNRVSYVFSHIDEFIAVGGVGAVFGAGSVNQTDITTDGAASAVKGWPSTVARKRSASRAAAHPEPAAVTAWR